MDVPELTEEFIEKIAAQSDEQAAAGVAANSSATATTVSSRSCRR